MMIEGYTQAKSGVSLDSPMNTTNKGLWHYKIIVLSILVMALAISTVLLSAKPIGNKPDNYKTQSTVAKNELPERNMLVYTRCLGGERQPNYCNLYVSGIEDLQERLIWTFEFPKVEQTDYEGGFSIEVHGVVNKNAVYTKSYWEKDDKGQSVYRRDINILGSIDLQTGGDSIIYKQTRYLSGNSTRDEKDDAYLTSVYLDKQNNRVYYSTEIGPGTGGKIIQYDLDTKQNKTIADNKNLDDTYNVKYASKDKLYLSSSIDYIVGNYYINKILELNNGTLSDTPKPWYNGVIDKNGTRVAYVDKEYIEPNSTLDLTLRVSDLEGKDIKDIYAIKDTRLPGDGYDGSYSYSSVGSYFFNEYGDRLSFSVRKNKRGVGYIGEDVTNYVSFLEPRMKDDPEFPGGKGGIVILPPENPNLYKTLVEVKPTEQEYRWVKFLTHGGLVEGRPQDGLVYEADGGWYLKEPVDMDHDAEKEIHLLEGRKVILIKADNVFLVP